jgi:hypothetical protein
MNKGRLKSSRARKQTNRSKARTGGKTLGAGVQNMRRSHFYK